MSLLNRPANDAPPFSPIGLLTPDQVAAELGVSRRTLAAWRSSRRNYLPYVKVGNRVRYRQQDVAAWVESRARGRAPAQQEAHQ